MNIIQQITSNPLQKQILILPDGSSFTLVIYFRPMQFGWFIQNLTYKNFVLNNLRITVSPNMLYQFKNQLPFGIACLSQDNREPSQQQDFSSGAAKLYVLTKEECDQYARLLSGTT